MMKFQSPDLLIILYRYIIIIIIADGNTAIIPIQYFSVKIKWLKPEFLPG